MSCSACLRCSFPHYLPRMASLTFRCGLPTRFPALSCTGVIVFIFADEPAQVAVALVIACMFALIYEALAPYSSRWDAWISRSGHVIVLLSIFVAFLLEQEVSDEAGSSQDLYGGVLLAINVSMVLAVAVQGGTMAYSVTRSAEALPRSVSLAAVGFDVEGSNDRNPGRRALSAREEVVANSTSEADRAKSSQRRNPFRPRATGFAAFFVRNGKSFQAVTATSNEPPRSTFDDEPTDRNQSEARWHF